MDYFVIHELDGTYNEADNQLMCQWGYVIAPTLHNSMLCEVHGNLLQHEMNGNLIINDVVESK